MVSTLKPLAGSKILFLHWSFNPVHCTFAEAVGSHSLSVDFALRWTREVKFYKKVMGVLASSLLLPKSYEIYFCEGTFPIPVMARKFHLLPRHTKVIALLADPHVYNLSMGITRGIKRTILLDSLRGSDGFICVGKMEKELLSKLVNKPSVVVEPFIPPELYDQYLPLTPDLEAHRIVFVGWGPNWFYKGIDLLIEGFKKARREMEDLRLDIVGGRWSLRREWVMEGLRFVGFQKSLVPFFKKSALYVHVGRGDAFPLSVLEAMLSGLPTIVSKWTGTKEVVKKLGRNFIADITPDDVAEKILRYFDSSLKKRRIVSKKSKRLAAGYRKDEKVKSFKKHFWKLVEEIDR